LIDEICETETRRSMAGPLLEKPWQSSLKSMVVGRHSDEQKESQPISLPPLLHLLSFKPALTPYTSHQTCTADT